MKLQQIKYFRPYYLAMVLIPAIIIISIIFISIFQPPESLFNLAYLYMIISILYTVFFMYILYKTFPITDDNVDFIWMLLLSMIPFGIIAVYIIAIKKLKSIGRWSKGSLPKIKNEITTT